MVLIIEQKHTTIVMIKATDDLEKNMRKSCPHANIRLMTEEYFNTWKQGKEFITL